MKPTTEILEPLTAGQNANLAQPTLTATSAIVPPVAGPVTDANSAVARMEACYALNRALWNTPPPPSPRTIIETLTDALLA